MLKNRLIHWEEQMGRCCNEIVCLRTDLGIQKAHIVVLYGWMNWTRRVREWFGKFMVDFPWK